ncbi:cysteine desulfurase NifS [Candidatus Caldatribacterium saccharofermentans]|uniref:cysteine desulfurase NifS n=1 Tax=Candidatus Caldatribacterium saccharofermentans TaxID=1454753 RepID=UPI003D0807EC
MIYLDYNATTPCDPRVVEAMLPFFREHFGNPSSLHRFGQEARQMVEKARSVIARSIGARDEEIVFTSGGTESNNLAIRGVAQALRKKGNHLVTSSIEHHAVLNVFRALEKEGFAVTYLPVDREGLVHPEDLKKALRPETILVSIMHANNETGVIEPVEELSRVVREHGAVFHTDAVQTVGKIPVRVDDLGVDLLSASAHKFYGPKGVGFLYIRKGTRLVPQILGGHHERGRRAGTENVPGIVGMAKALEIAQDEMHEEARRVGALRDRLEEELQARIPDIVIVSRGASRLYNTSLVLVEYVEGESLLLNLDFEGICVSSGSACTSSSLEPSHVLLACGYPHALAHGSIRFSLGKWTTEEEISRVVAVFPGIVEKLRAISPFGKAR